MLLTQKHPYGQGHFCVSVTTRGLFYWLRNNTLLLECTDCMRRKRHRYILSVNNKRLSLKIRFKNAFSAMQRKTYVMTELFTFAG